MRSQIINNESDRTISKVGVSVQNAKNQEDTKPSKFRKIVGQA
jgi:hypothetical protein